MTPRAAPRSTVAIFLFAFFGWTFDFYDLALISYVRAPVAKDLHLSHDGEVWMLGVALGTSGLGGIVAGALADRFGKRAMLSATILVYSVGSLASGLAPSLAAFLVARGIVGLGVGGEWAIGHGMVAEAVAPRLRGRASALLQSGEPLGVALAAFAGYVVLPHVGWRWIMIGSSATALLALAARSSIHLLATPAAAHPPWGALLAPRIAGRMALAWVLGVFKLGTYWSCYIWLPGFLHDEMHQDVARSLTWIVTAQAGQLVGMLTFGVVADRVGRRPAFAAYSVATAVALAALAFRWQRLVEEPLAFWAVMLLLGFGSGCTAGFGALLAELFPTEVRGAAMGTTYNLARGAQILAPVLVSAAVMRAGLTGGLSVPLVLALLTASWVWVLPETKGIVLPSLAGGDEREEEKRRRLSE
jgi:MFS family permease